MKASVFPRHPYSREEAEQLRLDLMSRHSSFAVNIESRAHPGDPYSRMILGLHNAIRTSRLAVTGDKDIALQIIGTANVALGLVTTLADAEAVAIFHRVHSGLGGLLLIEGESRVHLA